MTDYRQAIMELVVEEILDTENMLLGVLEHMSDKQVKQFISKNDLMGTIEHWEEYKAENEE